MFKLLKLGFYALIGYALYEMYQGMKEGGSMEHRSGRSFDRGNRGQMTGPGEGMEEGTHDRYGAETTHTVGRGVVE